MDENLNVQTPDVQDTIPDEVGQQTTGTTTTETAATAPQEQQDASVSAARDTDRLSAQQSVSEKGTENAQDEPFVTVRYNHENRDLTREQTVTYAQKGIHMEALHTKLGCLAASLDMDVDAFVDRLVKAPEDAHRKHLEELYGKDSEDVEIGMEIFRKKQSADYEKLLSEKSKQQSERERLEEKSVQSRLAEQYRELKREIPDTPDFAHLPDSVITEAASGKRDLFSAYLRYLYSENKKIDAANKSQQAAAEASAGSKAQTGADDMSSFDRGFLDGIWGR